MGQIVDHLVPLDDCIYLLLLCPLVLDAEFLFFIFSTHTPCLSHHGKHVACLPVYLCHHSAGLADFLLCFYVLQREDVATQFGQMNLSRQSSGETPEPPAGPVYPPSLMAQPSQQPSYVIASTGQQLPTGGFSGSGPSISQQVLQAPPSPQGFVQQPPPAQVSMLVLTPVTCSRFGVHLDLYISIKDHQFHMPCPSGPDLYSPPAGPGLSCAKP